MKRPFSGICRSIVLASGLMVAVSAAVPAMAHSNNDNAHNNSKSHKKKPLVIADEGSFFVNGKVVTSEFPNVPTTGVPTAGKVIANQMYVRYMIPKDVRRYTKGNKAQVPPVIMIHGSGHTGATFETTPDGREGWATYFLRQGFPVYVVDHSGRARSGFSASIINQAKVQSKPEILPNIVQTTHESAWVGFRIGPEYGVANPGQQFPIEAFDQYAAQLVPNSEVTLDGAGNNSTDAVVALLDKIGPAIIIAHSQGTTYAIAATVKRPNLVKGLVLLEGSCASTPAEISSAFSRSPYMAIIGDYRPPERNVVCKDTVAAINAAGGKATFWLLPDSGIKGNTHMMMMDRNSDQIAAKTIEWLTSNGNNGNNSNHGNGNNGNGDGNGNGNNGNGNGNGNKH